MTASIPTIYPTGGAYGTSYLASELFDDYLQIGYAWFGMVDSSGGWSGNVSPADGVPSEVLWHYTHQYPSICIGFSLLPHPS